jgi:hypothetical protein
MIGSEVDELDDGRHMLEKAGGGGCHHVAETQGLEVPKVRCYRDAETPGLQDPKVRGCHHDTESRGLREPSQPEKNSGIILDVWSR